MDFYLLLDKCFEDMVSYSLILELEFELVLSPTLCRQVLTSLKHLPSALMEPKKLLAYKICH